MAKSIKLKNNTYWDTTSITHKNKKLSEYMNLIGSCACFSKTDDQNLTPYVGTQILFNNTDYVDNECFELLNDGTIKVLKDVSKIQINFNIRIIGNVNVVNILYCTSTTDSAGFNVSTNFSNWTISGAGILKVQKGDVIKLRFYTGDNSVKINGYNKSWCCINLCVIK